MVVEEQALNLAEAESLIQGTLNMEVAAAEAVVHMGAVHNTAAAAVAVRMGEDGVLTPVVQGLLLLRAHRTME